MLYCSFSWMLGLVRDAVRGVSYSPMSEPKWRLHSASATTEATRASDEEDLVEQNPTPPAGQDERTYLEICRRVYRSRSVQSAAAAAATALLAHSLTALILVMRPCLLVWSTIVEDESCDSLVGQGYERSYAHGISVGGDGRLHGAPDVAERSQCLHTGSRSARGLAIFFMTGSR